MNTIEKSTLKWSARAVDATLRLCVDYPWSTIGAILLLTVWAILQHTQTGSACVLTYRA